MKSFALSAVVAAAATISMPAQAAIFTFVTTLSSAGEPVATSTATGNATVTFNDVLGTVAVNLTWAGLANAAPFGHIHCCTATPGTGNASVLLDFGAITAATTATFTNTYTPAAATFTNLLAGVQAGRAYVNIHTPGTYQSGEIRGFLAPIPEPGTYLMMFGGLAAIGAMVRRRAQRQA